MPKSTSRRPTPSRQRARWPPRGTTTRRPCCRTANCSLRAATTIRAWSIRPKSTAVRCPTRSSRTASKARKRGTPMCGIVAAAARRDVVATLIDGLKALEYRGYDSAGIALLTERGLERVRAKGKVQELERLHAAQPIAGFTGIAHTRWATHGAPSAVNAHPITSCDDVAVVHNGIIENHDELRLELAALGYEFASETDTEVIAHLIEHFHAAGARLIDAVQQAAARLTGAYAIAAISKREPGCLVGARRGSPMVIGLGEGEQFIASDIHALLPLTRRFIYLADGQSAEVTFDGVRLFDERGERVEGAVTLAHCGVRRRRRGAARPRAQRASRGVRLELPCCGDRTLLDRSARRRAVQRRDRLGIPL